MEKHQKTEYIHKHTQKREQLETTKWEITTPIDAHTDQLKLLHHYVCVTAGRHVRVRSGQQKKADKKKWKRNQQKWPEK